MRGFLVLFVIYLLLCCSGCASMLVASRNPIPAHAENLRYGYFPATRVDLSAIRHVWSDEKTILPGKVIGTAFMALDMPLSLAFDLVLAAPVNYIQGNPPPPWHEVTEVRWGQVGIKLGMSDGAARSALARAGLPEPWVWHDIWFVRPASRTPGFARTSVTGATIELDFREGELVRIWRYAPER